MRSSLRHTVWTPSSSSNLYYLLTPFLSSPAPSYFAVFPPSHPSALTCLTYYIFTSSSTSLQYLFTFYFSFSLPLLFFHTITAALLLLSLLHIIPSSLQASPLSLISSLFHILYTAYILCSFSQWFCFSHHIDWYNITLFSLRLSCFSSLTLININVSSFPLLGSVFFFPLLFLHSGTITFLYILFLPSHFLLSKMFHLFHTFVSNPRS